MIRFSTVPFKNVPQKMVQSCGVDIVQVQGSYATMQYIFSFHNR